MLICRESLVDIIREAVLVDEFSNTHRLIYRLRLVGITEEAGQGRCQGQAEHGRRLSRSQHRDQLDALFAQRILLPKFIQLLS